MDRESGSALSSRLHAEIALIVAEVWYFLPKEIGDVSGHERTSFALASVDEDSLLLGVCVQVDEQKTTFLVQNGPFGVVYFRTADLVVAVPDSVEIIT